MVCLAFAESGCACAHIYRSGAAEVACGLQEGAFLSVMKRECLDVVERELAEVYLAVLGVAEGHAVVDNAGMVCAHGADVDCLDTSDAAVVFHLYAGEIA